MWGFIRKFGWLVLALPLFFVSDTARFNTENASTYFPIINVSINLAQPGPRAIGIGFLHGPAPSPQSPAGHLVAALHPKLWRASWPITTLTRAPDYGAQPMIIVSDYWRYPHNGWPNGKPYEDSAKWRTFMVKAAKSEPDKHWIWDIWNEPDVPGFFDGTFAQFNSLFITADRILHKIRGADIQIAGPSPSYFDLDALTAFAKVLMEAHAKLEVLAWHENSVPASKASLITQHLREARKRFIDNPEFAALGVKKLMVTEFAGPRYWLTPAALVAYRGAFEAGRADAIARACWKWPNHKSSCFDGSMDGLITAKGLPRSAWWTALALSPRSEYRVQSQAPPHWHVIANKDSLVLGRLHGSPARLRIRIAGLKASGILRACANVIPDSGVTPLPDLASPRCQHIPITNGSTTLELAAPPPGAALWLRYTEY